MQALLGPVWWLSPLMLPIESSASGAAPLANGTPFRQYVRGRTVTLLFLSMTYWCACCFYWVCTCLCHSCSITFSTLMTMMYVAGAVAEDTNIRWHNAVFRVRLPAQAGIATTSGERFL